MIRSSFKHQDLGYIAAERAFRTEASKCGKDVQRQLARAERQYMCFLTRHAPQPDSKPNPDDVKFLRGVDKAWDEFQKQRIEGPGKVIPNPTYIPTPAAPGSDAAGEVEMSPWQSEAPTSPCAGE